MNEVLNALKPVVHRIRRNRMLQGAATGLAVGAVAALGVQILSFFFLIGGKGWIMAGCAAGSAVLAGVINALRPVSPREAARAADGCGLKERATTALEVSGEGAMDGLLQRDACDRLRELDPRQIAPGRAGKRLLAALGCAAAAAVLFAVPNTPEKGAAELKTLRMQTAESVKKVEEAVEKDAEGLSEEEKNELRRLTADLKKELAQSQDRTDALVALDRAEQRLEQMRRKMAGDALESLADALAAAGLDGLAEALRSGDEAAMAAALESVDAKTLAEAAEGLKGDAKELAEELAAAAAGGNAAQAASAMSSGQTGNSLQQTAGALQQMAAGLKGQNAGGEGNQASAGNGSGRQGGNGPGQSGNGAGQGSTNREEGSGAGGSGNVARGSAEARYKEGEYETIYDPERIEREKEDVMTRQNRLEGESAQTEIGPGKGTLAGDVPYGEVVAEYAKSEALAAERENLTEQERQWVREYFTLLTEQ